MLRANFNNDRDIPAFGRRHFGRGFSGGEANSVDTHRSGNVFEALFAQIVEGEVETPGYVS